MARYVYKLNPNSAQFLAAKATINQCAAFRADVLSIEQLREDSPTTGTVISTTVKLSYKDVPYTVEGTASGDNIAMALRIAESNLIHTAIHELLLDQAEEETAAARSEAVGESIDGLPSLQDLLDAVFGNKEVKEQEVTCVNEQRAEELAQSLTLARQCFIEVGQAIGLNIENIPFITESRDLIIQEIKTFRSFVQGKQTLIDSLENTVEELQERIKQLKPAEELLQTLALLKRNG